MLAARQPIFVWWGDDLNNLYNDTYRNILQGTHPEALGQPASLVWQEIWDQVGPRAEQAMLRNEGTYDEALLLIMQRNGYPEETYYTFSYSPVPNDQGGTGGIICANTEDTRRIVSERQLALLRELAAAIRARDEFFSVAAHGLKTPVIFVLRVRDPGIGLPPDDRETIFEPFGRADNATRQHMPGMGLGLYICRRIAEQHGGRT